MSLEDKELVLPELTAAAEIQLFDNTALISVSMPKLVDGAGGVGDVETYEGVDGPQLAVVFVPVLEVLSMPALTDAGSVVFEENFDYALTGLESLEAVGRLTINSTTALTDLDVLDAVRHVGVLEVKYNQRLCQSVIDAWVGGRSVDTVDFVDNGDC